MSDLLNEHYDRDKKIRAYLSRNKEIEKQILDRAKRWEDASKYPEFNPSELPTSNVNKCTSEELKQFINDQNNAMLKQGKAMEAILSQLDDGARCEDTLLLRSEIEERNNILRAILGKLEGMQ